jgi:4-hydroxy-tetrahydrodipicolinate synthase
MARSLGDLLTAMATPFAADGSLDVDGARRLARHLVEHGSDGLVVAGTTGEGPTVTEREKLELFEAVVGEVGGTSTVIANTGSYDTHHSVTLTRSALACGVDGVMAVTPYYSKPPEAGIIAHFTAVAEAADGRPVIVYNIPQRVVVNLSPALLARLAEIPNVVAVKQATPDLDQAQAILDHGGLALYAGNDDLVLPFVRMGGAGGICVASHLAGSRIKEMITRIRAGDLAAAERIETELQPLLDGLAVTTNPIPLKAALAMAGLPAGGLRLPLVEATADEAGRVRTALEQAHVPLPAISTA